MRIQSIRLALVIVLLCPLAQSQWVQTNGPYGGQISALGASGTNIFAATIGGVFLSTDNGTSWRAVHNGLPKDQYGSLPGVTCFAYSGTNLFAGTFLGGVYSSTNNGASWTTASDGLPMNSSDPTTFVPVQCLALSGQNLFAGTAGGGVFLTTNGGTSWTSVNGDLTNPYILALAANDTNLFAGTDAGVFRSTNNGSSWTSANPALRTSVVSSLAASGTNLFAVASGYGVLLSTNNGASWSPAGLAGTYIMCLAVSGTNLLAGTNDGVYLSSDNGTYWRQINVGLANNVVECLAVKGTEILAGTNDGLFLSTDSGAKWTQTGVPGTSVTCLAASGASLFAGGGFNGNGGIAEGVFRSTNSGTNWVAVDSGLVVQVGRGFGKPVVNSIFLNGTNILAGVGMDGMWGHGGVFVSTDNGDVWTAAGLVEKIVYSLAGSGTNLYAGTSGGVFLSTNSGTSWSQVNSGLTSLHTNALAVIGTFLFAGTDSGGVFLSTNSGTSWTQVISGLSNIHVNALVVSGTNLFAGTDSGGAFLSTNLGTSWTHVGAGLTCTYVTSFAVAGNALFAGTWGGGVYCTTNNGTIWTAVNLGLTNTNVWSLAVSGTDLYAGTEGGGVLRRDLSEMITDIEGKQQLPTSCTLEQNFPNPFNPSTTIRYGLPHKSVVGLTVYTTLGQHVATLVHGEQEAGYHEVKFEGSGLSSGVYFYRLRAGDFLQTKKLLLVR